MRFRSPEGVGTLRAPRDLLVHHGDPRVAGDGARGAGSVVDVPLDPAPAHKRRVRPLARSYQPSRVPTDRVRRLCPSVTATEVLVPPQTVSRSRYHSAPPVSPVRLLPVHLRVSRRVPARPQPNLSRQTLVWRVAPSVIGGYRRLGSRTKKSC